jgi:hypothetical protein
MDGSESAAEHFVDNRSSSSRCSARPRRETVASALSESISNTTSNHARRGNQSNPLAVETICKSTAFNALPAVTLSNETRDRKKSLKSRFDYMNLLFFSLFDFLLCNAGKIWNNSSQRSRQPKQFKTWKRKKPNKTSIT